MIDIYTAAISANLRYTTEVPATDRQGSEKSPRLGLTTILRYLASLARRPEPVRMATSRTISGPSCQSSTID